MRPSLPAIISLSRQIRRAFRRKAQKARDATLCKRYLIIVLLSEGHSSVVIQRHLKVARAHVSRTARRYLTEGEAGLQDRREENGNRKVDERFLWILQQLLPRHPTECGWERTTWSRELLCLEMEKQAAVRVSRSTMGTCLQVLGARWGRARPFVLCPWPKARRRRRLREIRKILARAGASEEVFFADEVDIDLNPRIGPDWMLPNQQKRVRTPGTNVKHYLAGALNHRTGNLIWVGGDQKRSWLFLNLIRALLRTYRRARILHVILDNYIIHSSRITRMALAAWGRRVRLHFLPPYCPQHNRIEILWLQLHANVTRNHRCLTRKDLWVKVNRFLENAIPFPGNRPSIARMESL